MRKARQASRGFIDKAGDSVSLMYEAQPRATAKRRQWAFISSHASVLLAVERHPEAIVRELAETVRLTERQVHRILEDLETEGYITRTRVGRQNHYTVMRRRRLDESTIPGAEVGDLLDVLTERRDNTEW